MDCEKCERPIEDHAVNGACPPKIITKRKCPSCKEAYEDEEFFDFKILNKHSLFFPSQEGEVAFKQGCAMGEIDTVMQAILNQHGPEKCIEAFTETAKISLEAGHVLVARDYLNWILQLMDIE